MVMQLVCSDARLVRQCAADTKRADTTNREHRNHATPSAQIITNIKNH